MKLKNKTFVYSLMVATIVGGLLISYLVFLLPSLYQDYQEKKIYNHVVDEFNYYQEHKQLSSRVATNVFALKVEHNSYDLRLSVGGNELLISIHDKEFKGIIDLFRNNKLNEDNIDNVFNLLKDKIKVFDSKNQIKVLRSSKIVYKEQKTKVKQLDKNSTLFQGSVLDTYSNVEYTSSFIYSKNDKEVVLFSSANVSPQTTDILPVILGSLTTLIPLIVLLAFVLSSIFAKTFVDPIIKLSKDATSRNSNDVFIPIEDSSKDEIGDLTRSLNQLYQRQKDYLNRIQEDNKKQEVFMRASAHQLKTPLASSLLLVDSLLQGVYEDKEKGLVELRKQVKNMTSLVDEMNRINYLKKDIQLESIDVRQLIDNLLSNQKLNLDEKNLNVEVQGNKTIKTSLNILTIVIENLINNAISYTSKDGNLLIEISDNKICFSNYPTYLDQEIKADIFEPFVSSNKQKGRGLGLYIVKYLLRLINMDICLIDNENKVTFIIEMENKNDRN